MLCLNTQSQWVSPLASAPACPDQPNRYSDYTALPLTSQADDTETSISRDSQPHRQWPWRLFPFASDLGTVGCLLNRPKLGIIGWAIAMPYYLYAILHQSGANQRKDEILYQATANGLLPFLAAKVGVQSGRKLHQFVSKNRLNIPGVLLKQPHLQLLGGLLGLLILTPLVGDPISQQICQKYQERKLNVSV